MKKTIKKQKTNIIFILILIAFVFLLISIPSFIDNNSNAKATSQTFQDEKEDPYETSKFQYISTTILEKITTTKINQINLAYINELIYENKIINRDHTIGQEIIAQYINGNTNISSQIAREFIEINLNEFETQKERMWRNQKLTIEHFGKETIIYDDEKLILDPLQAKSIGINTQVISPYEYQIYTFTFENGTQEEVTLNLLTKQGEEKLENYIDFETNTPKIKFESIESKFIMSKDRFEIKYIIWK